MSRHTLILLLLHMAAIGSARPAWGLIRGETLPVFTAPGARSGVKWTSSVGTTATGQALMDGNASGIRLPCPLSTATDRVSWDFRIPLDLAHATGVSLRLRTGTPAAIRSITLYLRSGEGWYAASTQNLGTDWRTVHWNLSEFGTEGTPDGWGAISAIRISAWRGDGRDAVIELADLQRVSHRILIVRSDRHAAANPADAWTVNHYPRLTRDWLGSIGVPAAIVSDRRIEGGFPDGCRIAILPYNPDLGQAATEALQRLTARGGALIVCYSLPEALEPLLGIARKGWTAPPAPEAFTSIGISAPPGRGYPAGIRQESWNAIIATPVTARVIGTWHNGEGADSGIPAITLGANGAFISHVLTNRDRQRKAQLLAALIVELQPALRQPLATSLLAHAERLLHLESWDAIQGFLREQARRNGTLPQALADIAAIESYRAATEHRRETAPFGDILTRAEVTRSMLAQAYLRTRPAFRRPGEWRGIWAHDPAGVAGHSWETISARLGRDGFTALLPNLLWPGRAYFPADEFTGIRRAGQPDLLAESLEACRRHGLELHLWKVCWNLQRAPAEWTAKLRAEGRLQRSAQGEPIDWLCPSHPENRRIERQSVIDAAIRYPIDGIHLDYIRYPGANACFCQGCRTRFTATRGAPIGNWPADVTTGGRHAAAWQAWRRQQITTFVQSVRAALREVRPEARLSVAVFGSIADSRTSMAQDWPHWMEAGLVDFVTPMNYTASDPEFQRYLDAQTGLATDKVKLYPGIGVSSPGLPTAQVARQIDLLRAAGSPGFILFQLDRDTFERVLPALTQP